MDQPSITVSERDYERIDALLEQAGDRHPGILALRAELERADVVTSEQMPADVVTMNSTVHFENVDTGTRFQLGLVYPQDSDGSASKVSILAPVGSALLGLAVGQTIHWPGPGGNTIKLRVLEVQDQPEARNR